jgi:hypothetical protein
MDVVVYKVFEVLGEWHFAQPLEGMPLPISQRGRSRLGLASISTVLGSANDHEVVATPRKMKDAARETAQRGR